MHKAIRVIGVCCVLALTMSNLAVTAMAAPTTAAPATERYLHVKVDDATKGESVNVNLPLSMAAAILPTVNKGTLHNGHVTIGEADFNGVDVRALLDAIRTAPDNEFVTVKEKDQDVRVAKSDGDPDRMPNFPGLENVNQQMGSSRERASGKSGRQPHLHSAATDLLNPAQFLAAIVKSHQLIGDFVSGITSLLGALSWDHIHFPPTTSLAIVCNCMFDVPS